MALIWLPQPTVATRLEEDWHAELLRSMSGDVGQARILRSSPLRRLQMSWAHLSAADAMTIRDVIKTTAHPGSRAHMYCPMYLPERISVATADGATSWWRVGLTDVDLSMLAPVCLLDGVAQPTSEWGLGWENLIEASEDLSDTTEWYAVGGATVTRTGGQIAPDGSATAWRIETSGGTDTGKVDNIAYGGTFLQVGWKWYMGVWARNLSTTKYLRIVFRGFGLLARIPPSTNWAFYSGICNPTYAFSAGIRFAADSAADALDFVVWHPQIIAFLPDGSMAGDKAWCEASGYVPTPSSTYIAGDTTLRRWTLAFRSAPAGGKSIVLKAFGRRLLWGRFTSSFESQTEVYGRTSIAAEFEGGEATGDET